MNKIISSRISWIDIARGIGILLVLYGHALGSDKNRFLIYAFHMPLFFFLSGIVFKRSSSSIFAVIRKNFKGILVPYFVFAILTLVLGMLILPSNYTYESFTKQLYGILFGNANEGYLAFNTALWFLPCLFVTRIAFDWITRVIRNKRFIISLLVALSVVAYIISVYDRSMKLPFGIEIALNGLVFFGMGYLWSQNEKLKAFVQNKKIIVLIVSALSLGAFAWFNFSIYGSQIDMRINRLNDYFLFYLAAFSGIIMTIAGSMLIGKNKVLEYVGKHSLVLLGWHTLLFTYFKHVHFFPPIVLDFLTPTLHLTFATTIILLIRLLLVKTRTTLSLQKNKAN